MSLAPASRSRRSATVAATAPSSSSSSAYHPNPSGPPPPPPSNHPNQSVQAYSSQQIQIQLPHQLPPRPDYHQYDSDPQQLQHSYSESNLYSQQQQPPPQATQQSQQPQQQQENWPDYNWRSIFDAALVKAQQAVQLDELGETVLATQLYAQAANDLGRVIPMCGSEKKKQSMLTIQAIYLDRVQQLKTAAKANAASKKATTPAPAPQVSEEDVRYNPQQTIAYQQQQQEDHHQHQYHYHQQQQQQQQYSTQEYFLPQPSYQPSPEQYHPSQDSYPYQQQQQQQPYQPPPPPTPPIAPQTSEKESSGFKLFGKKKSKPQMDDHAQQQQQQPIQDTSNYATYNDYNNNINGGYISPPYSEPQKATGSPATLVTPVFMTQTQTPSLTPPIASNNSPVIETPPEQPTKSSRWKPFGKKKSKSFSAGETSSGPYRPPNDYEIPAPLLPMGAQQQKYQQQQQHQNLVDPGDHADAYSQQKHADWFVGNDDGTMLMDDYEQHTRYYDEDEDEDVDPYYIADNRGRAQAYEGKDTEKQPSLSKAPSKEESLKENRKKPTLGHKASSYSNEQSFTLTFGSIGGNGAAYSEEPVVYYQGNGAMTDEQMFTAAYDDDGCDYEDDQQGQYDIRYQQQLQQQQQDQYSQQGAPFDAKALVQHQHTQYNHDPSLPPLPVDAELEPEEKSSTKNKWFGKKNKKKDPSAETYDDVAKRMDEALFGGGGSSSRKKDKNKDKSKDKKSETTAESTVLPVLQSPPLPHVSELRTSTLPPPRKTSSEYDIRQFSFERSASLDVGFMGEDQQQQRYYAEEPQSQHQYQQQYHTSASAANATTASVVMNPDEINPSGPVLTLAPSTPKALIPVTYAPRTIYEPKTVYTPASKKPLPQPEELISEPVQLPSGLDLGMTFQQQQQQQLQQQKQQQQQGTAGSIHSQEDGSLSSSDPIKKSKSRPFNLFKSKKSNSKLSLDDGSPLSPTFGANDDSKSTHSDKTRKSSIQSNDRKAVDAAAAAAYSKNGGKKRESDEYVPYEYQEDVEGPLMERVAVREDRDIIGFVLPVEEIIDYTAEGTDEATALENWDSWVNQLESFEKVLADKGLKKDKSKKSKKAAKKAAKEEAVVAAAAASALTSPGTPTSPMGSLKGNRSSIFSSGMSEHRPMSVSDESARTSMYSTRSSAIFGAELMSVQQAKRRWWNPKRKEATSVYSVSDSLSLSEQDQEKYLSSLLQNHQDASPLSPSSSTDPRILQSQPDQHQRVTTADVLAVMAAAEERENRERQEALNALLETDGINRGGASLSLPLPQVGSMTSSIVSTQGLPSIESSEIVVSPVVPVIAKSTNVEKEESAEAEAQPAAEEEEDEVAAPMPPKAVKAKIKSTKSKLLPISTPLAQILKIQNPEELWLYVQQAKTYAATRMNKGDKRSAAIALKRAQALEARWQEIMLDLASSEEDEDELLDDDDDDEEEEENEEEEEEEEDEEEALEVKVVPKSKAKTVAVTPLVVNTSNKKVAVAAKEAVKVEEEQQQVKSPVTSAAAKITTIHPVEEEGEGEDADEERRRLHLRKVTSRSDSASDMFSKYKVGNKAAGGSSKNTLAVSTEEAAEDDDIGANTDGDDDDGDESETEGVKKGKGKGGNKSLSSIRDSRLGEDATMEQMLVTTDVEHLKFYIQRMKTDTVAKARSGSKFAALEGMKNVKVLQQRLAELEGDGEEEEKEGGAEGGEQAEVTAA
ncbi:hypothetical protein BG015_003242 [Linnemannia schmuckeri]|uniref:MIT domain-containing protein n=1 Tax=Linnemannia schmuckeri TaxID=64567 RepID=A0A9P5SAN8_9FUNG|nr:hypothetical protein BG015_003242 [Linnemannia schmuckeri]